MIFNKKNILLIFVSALFSLSNKAETNSLLLNTKKTKFHTSYNLQQAFSSDSELLNANRFFKSEQYSKALEEALNVLIVAEKNSDYSTIYSCNILIGKIFKKRNKHRKALKHFKNSLDILIKSSKGVLDLKHKNKNSEILIAETYLLLGTEYSLLNKSDSAKLSYLKVINMGIKNIDISKIKASALNNISALYTRDSSYNLAKKYAQQAISLHKKANSKVSEASALSNLASIYLLEQNYKKARQLYQKGLNLIKNDNSDLSIRYKEDLYYNLAWTLYLLKDYKAYEFQEKSFLIKDDLRDREIKRIVKGVYEKHKVDLEQQKVNLTREKRKLAEAQESKTNILFGALTLLVIIISGVVIYNYKLRQKNLQLKLSENSLLQQQSIEKLKSEAHTKILNAALDGKESERKEIAEILHDNVSALLSSANMHLSATKKQLHNNTPTEIEKTQSIILEASQKVRDLSHNLVSSILLKFGLEYAIKDVAKKYSNSELKFDVSANNINRYNQEFEIKIFNVIQELINNIIKHSKANNAEVILKEEKSQLTILVKDDGVGFSTSSSSLNDGIGLNQIEARVKMMNGKLTINSEINNGAAIFISVPIQQQKQSKLSSVS